VPGDAKGNYTIQVTFEMGPLAGKITGKKDLSVTE
jgi:hypothetical protein